MRILAVSVIELVGGNFQGIATFTETPEGNKLAEEHFAALIREYNDETDVAITDAGGLQPIIDEALEDGHYEGGMGYEIFLTHSHMPESKE